MFELHILDHDSSVVEVMEFETLRQAERAESGVNSLTNLSVSTWINYHTDIMRK